ncbi:MAG TPA: hypothetical protein VJ201_09070, partial [Candidatus Babeliales bacterium]|nr:hypothetical protein [Candidatus Babeliales bacterium]
QSASQKVVTKPIQHQDHACIKCVGPRFQFWLAKSADVKEILFQQLRYFVKTNLLKQGISQEEVDEISSRIIGCLGEAAQIKVTTDKEIAQVQENIKKIGNAKTTSQIEELRKLKEQENQLLEKKTEQENLLGIALQGASQVLAKQNAGEKTRQAVNALCMTLALSGQQYAAVVAKLTLELAYGIRILTKTKQVKSIRENSAIYYPLNFEKDMGGWLLGYDKTLGCLFLCFNYQMKNGQWSTDHREIVFDKTFPFTPIETLIEKIIAGEYKVSDVVFST